MTRAVAVLPKPPRHDPDAILLPHNNEAERSALGAAILFSEHADFIIDKLTPEAFFGRAHQDIFTAIRTLRDASQGVDFITLKNELTRTKRLDKVGGPAYIASLVDGIPRGTNVAYYVRVLKDLQTKRALVLFANHTIDLVAEGEHAGESIMNDTDRRLLELQAGHLEGRLRPVTETTRDLYADFEWRCEHPGELRGIDTGFPSINELTLGWQAGDLVVIAARPSIGKTTFALNSAVLAAQTKRRGADRQPTDTPVHVAIFSLEMRRQQLEYRILSQLSQVSLSRILNGHMGSVDYQKIGAALNVQSTLSINIDDRSGQSAIDIRAQCRRLKADGGLDLIVIDYVQLMPGNLERRGATRNDDITDISRRLKDLADECNAPVLLLSQLRRLEGRPKLDDLRESGSLEQAADIVLLLHRKDHRKSGVTEAILAKARNGPTGTVPITIDRDTVTFTDGGELQEETPEEKTAERRKHAARNARRKNASALYDTPADS